MLTDKTDLLPILNETEMHRGNRSWNFTHFKSVIPLPAICPNLTVSGGCLNREGFRVVSSPYSDLWIVGLKV